MDDLNIMPSMDKFVIFLEKGVSSPQGIEACYQIIAKGQ